MDDTEDDARYPPNPLGLNHHRCSSSHRPKLPVRNPTANNRAGYNDDEDDDDDEEGEEEDDPQRHRKRQQNPRMDEDEDEENEEEVPRGGREHAQRPEKHNYEFAPRPKRLQPPPPSFPRPGPADWTEAATNALLDIWGERFVQLGRKSLRSDEWHDVAEKVSAVAKIRLTDGQCRNRLDTLKKKYKREKSKLVESGGGSSRWVYFERMDSLMGSSPTPPPPPQPARQPLACGIDSGEYVFANSRGYMDQANGIDELGDSSESGSENDDAEDEDDDSDCPPPKKARPPPARARAEGDGLNDDAMSFRMLAESIQRFGEIYEKIENSKRQQMIELEKMRMEFQRELETQRRQILERAQAEIARIQKNDKDADTSVTHASG
ncbi:Trihelix transcription factor [Nymphaea thermarum]|nr:Trihelix transcription factor [Nymphaea thermarum]